MRESPVAISQWHLVGPGLRALIVCLAFRMRRLRARIREWLGTWLGMTLATGRLHQCGHEAAHAVLPVEEQLIDEVNRSALLHGDETSWQEAGKSLWRWVFTSPAVTFYLIGYRTRELLDNLLGEAFAGWLMSDGYQAYRAYRKRLRCWAHRVRKARGLEERLVKSSPRFGKQTLDVRHTVMQAVYEARKRPGEDLKAKHQERLDQFRAWLASATRTPNMRRRASSPERFSTTGMPFSRCCLIRSYPSQITKRSALCVIGSFYASSASAPEANKAAGHWRCWPASLIPAANAAHPLGSTWPK